MAISVNKKTALFLAGDIGGTKTNLAVFADNDPCHPLHESTYISAEAHSLEEMVSAFLSSTGGVVQQAAFGVAGPVINGKAKITKLPWDVDAQILKEKFSLTSVILVNDLVATAHGIDQLPAKSLITLKTGSCQPEKSPRAVIAPGTGLGEAFMLWGHGRYRGYATEGGHVPFAPVDNLQLELLGYLRSQFTHVSNDLLCSGSGLVLIYNFLRHYYPHEQELAWVAKAIASADDPAPVITQASFAKENSSLCQQAVKLFCAILAGECANLALKFMATGGIYIGGGIPPKILPALQHGDFITSFIGQSPLAGLLDSIAITMINEPKTALYGAASLLMD